MRPRTGLALGGCLLLVAGLTVFGLTASSAGGELREAWVSETPRDNEVNHHAVGVGPTGDVVVAPVAAVPGSDGVASDTACALVRLRPENGSARWRFGVRPQDCFTHALTEPAIDDVDGDGTVEVISSTTEGAVVVVDAVTGLEAFRAPLESYGYGRPTVADLLAHPGREIVASDIDGTVVLVRANGSVAWRTPLHRAFDRNLSVWDAPAVADVDDDGRREIVVGTNAGPAVLDADGTVAWNDRTAARDIVVAQADGDPQLELFAPAIQSIRSIDGRRHDIEWRRDIGEGPRLRAAADGDDDGTLELYVGLSNGTVLALDAGDGTVEWATRITAGESAVVSAPVLGNADGTGHAEVVVTTRDGTVAVLDAADGTELAAYERTVPVWTFPTTADIDGDGRDELLVRYGDGRVVALDYEP